eukprot:2107568-Prymnesium_polylepis.1
MGSALPASSAMSAPAELGLPLAASRSLTTGAGRPRPRPLAPRLAPCHRRWPRRRLRASPCR